MCYYCCCSYTTFLKRTCGVFLPPRQNCFDFNISFQKYLWGIKKVFASIFSIKKIVGGFSEKRKLVEQKIIPDLISIDFAFVDVLPTHAGHDEAVSVVVALAAGGVVAAEEVVVVLTLTVAAASL